MTFPAIRAALAAEAREWVSLVVVFAFVLGGCVVFGAWPTHSTLLSLWSQASVITLAALGLSLGFCLRGIDLSIGAVFSLVVIVLSKFVGTVAMGYLVGAVFVAGACVGFINSKVARYVVSTTLATILTMALLEGVSNAVSSIFPTAAIELGPMWKFVGWGTVLGLPFGELLVLVVAIGLMVGLHYSGFGATLVAIGSNERRAQAFGVNIPRARALVMMISSMCACGAAVLYFCRYPGASPLVGHALLIDAVLVVLLAGGRLGKSLASPLRAIAGGIIVAFIEWLVSLAGYIPEFRYAAATLVVLILLAISSLRQPSNAEQE